MSRHKSLKHLKIASWHTKGISALKELRALGKSDHVLLSKEQVKGTCGIISQGAAETRTCGSHAGGVVQPIGELESL